MKKLTAICIIIGTPALADIASCPAIEDNTARLACFDEATAAPSSAIVQNQEIDTTSSKWDINVRKSPIDDSETVVMSVESNELLYCGYGGGSPATLILRCSENTTAAYISTDCHMTDIQSYGQVTMRLDRDTAFTQGFTASTNNRALGAWSGRHAIPLAKKLSRAEKLTARFTPYNKNAQTVTFDIQGIAEGLNKVATACNWDLP